MGAPHSLHLCSFGLSQRRNHFIRISSSVVDQSHARKGPLSTSCFVFEQIGISISLPLFDRTTEPHTRSHTWQKLERIVTVRAKSVWIIRYPHSEGANTTIVHVYGTYALIQRTIERRIQWLIRFAILAPIAWNETKQIYHNSSFSTQSTARRMNRLMAS